MSSRTFSRGRFKGKRALVTGAAQGLGRCIASHLVQEGAEVVIFDINQGVLASAERELTRLGNVVAVAGDTSKRDDVRQAVRAAVSRFGGLDVVVAQAGIGDVRTLLEIDDATWARMISINLTGVFLAVQEAARAMAHSNTRGAIVVTASTNAFFPERHTVHYSTAKGGVVALVKSAALDLAEIGIRINAVSPGVIRTPLAAPLVENPAVAAAFLRSVPLGRFGEPDEVARTVLFLASDEASYITGENIVIDGGTTVGMSLPIDDTAMPGFDAPGGRPESGNER